ncbi:hypothetical protein I204_05765 [Kwoniella mangroviensis CBS 8886]|nr:hypothetical protein I204_05765 [Kwoniella mangroviensis CBS 8886]
MSNTKSSVEQVLSLTSDLDEVDSDRSINTILKIDDRPKSFNTHPGNILNRDARGGLADTLAEAISLAASARSTQIFSKLDPRFMNQKDIALPMGTWKGDLKSLGDTLCSSNGDTNTTGSILVYRLYDADLNQSGSDNAIIRKSKYPLFKDDSDHPSVSDLRILQSSAIEVQARLDEGLAKGDTRNVADFFTKSIDLEQKAKSAFLARKTILSVLNKLTETPQPRYFWHYKAVRGDGEEGQAEDDVEAFTFRLDQRPLSLLDPERPSSRELSLNEQATLLQAARLGLNIFQSHRRSKDPEMCASINHKRETVESESLKVLAILSSKDGNPIQRGVTTLLRVDPQFASQDTFENDDVESNSIGAVSGGPSESGVNGGTSSKEVNRSSALFHQDLYRNLSRGDSVDLADYIAKHGDEQDLHPGLKAFFAKKAV